MSWTAVTSPSVAGYRVYNGTGTRAYIQQSGAGAAVGSSTTFTVMGLRKGVTHYFAVTSVDDSGRESPYSIEASKLVQ